MPFQAIDIRDTAHPIKLIADDWALLSAGTSAHWNTMTISWGGVGKLWRHDVAFVFVRPQRYTYELMQAQDYFTLAFGLPKETLTLCGKLSGRDGEKIAQAGLTTQVEREAVFPAEAELVLVCRKLHAQDLDPAGFIDPHIATHYDGDYHCMFVGEIVQCLRKTA
ncbi:MAG: flavin reductase [Oscillospiraceae bacterium]|nr:flavin reductase [Oscillospiraceae bacterium]